MNESGLVRESGHSKSIPNFSVNFHLALLLCTFVLCSMYYIGYCHFLTNFYVCPNLFLFISLVRCLSDLMFLRHRDILFIFSICVFLVAVYCLLYTFHAFCNYKQTVMPNNIDKRPKSKADLIAMVNARKIGTDHYYLFSGKESQGFH